MGQISHRFALPIFRTLARRACCAIRLATVCAGLFAFCAQTRATTVAPTYVNLGAAGQFAILSSGTTNGTASGIKPELSVSNAQISGAVGIGPGATGTFGGTNTVNGNFIYATSGQKLTSSQLLTLGLNGSQTQNSTLLTSAINAAVGLSGSIANFTATRTFSTTIRSSTTISNSGAVTVGAYNISVIDFNSGSGINLSQSSVLTLSGNANSIFYINFLGGTSGPAFNLSGNADIVLTGGLTANNVYWNIANGTSVQLQGGSAQGNFLAFNSSGQGTQIQANDAVFGSLMGGDVEVQPGAHITMVPEVSPGGMMGAFCCILLGSSSLKFWRRFKTSARA